MFTLCPLYDQFLVNQSENWGLLSKIRTNILHISNNATTRAIKFMWDQRLIFESITTVIK